MQCPLCNNTKVRFFDTDNNREYHKCSQCALIFVPPHQLLSQKDERDRYDKHDNSYANCGYRGYLQGKIDDIQNLGIDLSKGSILDFGAGKEAVMTTLLNEHSYNATAYDPLYGFNDLSLAPFSLIIMNEVIEHLYTPEKILTKVVSLLDKESYLYINTEFTNPIKDFSKWWYRSDPTHVHFYAEETFSYIAQQYALTLCESNHKNRVLLQKK